MNSSSFSPVKALSPDQRTLLRTALSSNSQTSPKTMTSTGMNGQVNGASSTPQLTDGQLDDQPLFDPLDDGQFDWDNPEQLFGDVPDFAEDGDLHDKRKVSDGSDAGEASKRQEGDVKIPKKPGRKPLTAEPATKRKAQNRAAQRAFRERKEHHLKNLETKVEDLEKASEATNHENISLRAQVDKLTTEVKEYRQRLSLNNPGQSSPPATRGGVRTNGGNDFSFAFPKFGDFPNSFLDNDTMARSSNVQIQDPTSTVEPLKRDPPSNTSVGSPSSANGMNGMSSTFSPPQTMSPSNIQRQNDANLQELTGLFSPSVLETASRSNSSDYSFPTTSSNIGSVRNGNLAQNLPQKVHRASSASTANSPASTMRFDSSVGTTPEPLLDSPIDNNNNNINKSDPILKTISEELTEAQRKNPAATSSGYGGSTESNPSKISDASSSAANTNTTNNFDWFVQENNGAFDPVLFGNYRDPQDNILSSLSDDFFTDALPAQDFTAPYNTGYQVPPEPKVDLMKEVEAKQDDDVVPDEAKYMQCPDLWRRIQQTESFQSGQVDMDDLCTQLTSKAKCSGKGAVIDEKEVDRILGPKATGVPDSKGMFGDFVRGD